MMPRSRFPVALHAARLLCAVCVAAATALSAPAGAASNPVKQCKRFPTMKKMKLQSVASEMEFNGIPMTIRHFDSEEDMAAVFAYYRAAWAGKGQGGRNPTEYPFGEWQVIATLIEPCFYTVQVKPKGSGSEGLLGLSALPGDQTTVKEDVPMLPDSRVINDIAHNDAGKTARTLLLRNGFSAETNADFYLKNLSDQGWQVLRNLRGVQHDTRAVTMVLKQGIREVSVTITQKGGESSVLLNYVDQP